MPVSPFEIIAGPADLWVAPTGTAFPLVNAAPGGSFFALGKTEGGVTVRHSQNIELLTADQHTGPIKAVRTEEHLEVETQLVELTLEKYAKILGDATVTTTAGPPATKDIPLYQNVDVKQYALLVRGHSPYMNANMQYQIPVVVQIEEPEVSFTKDDKAVLSVRFHALEDPAAGSAAVRFGKIFAQTS